jgi:hypothetical protein
LYFLSILVDCATRRVFGELAEIIRRRIVVAGGIEAVAASISAGLSKRLPRQSKKQRKRLALVTATMPDVRSANLMDLSASRCRAPTSRSTCA